MLPKNTPPKYAKSTWKPEINFLDIKKEYGRKVHLVIVVDYDYFNLPEIELVEKLRIETPYDKSIGNPSSYFLIGKFGGRTIGILARNGIANTIASHDIPYRANFWAIKKLNPTGVILVSPTKILNMNIQCGELVLAHDYVDLTGRVYTFSDKGFVANVSMVPAVCASMSKLMSKQAKKLGLLYRKRGIVACTLGPQGNSAAETRRMANMDLGKGSSPICPAPPSRELKYLREMETCASVIAVPEDTMPVT
jgi:purine nucleoside phosphorylase